MSESTSVLSLASIEDAIRTSMRDVVDGTTPANLPLRHHCIGPPTQLMTKNLEQVTLRS